MNRFYMVYENNIPIKRLDTLQAAENYIRRLYGYNTSKPQGNELARYKFKEHIITIKEWGN